MKFDETECNYDAVKGKVSQEWLSVNNQTFWLGYRSDAYIVKLCQVNIPSGNLT